MTSAEIAFGETMGASARQMGDLAAFRQVLSGWTGRMNLVGPSALDAFWDRHALDSAQLFHVEQQALRWADVGSGAGFPGVVLAILLKGRPGAQVHLIESMAKRVAFLEHVCAELELPARVHHARAESMVSPPRVDVVTARACAPLPRLLDFVHGFLKAGARGAFLKGRKAELEIAEALRLWSFRAELVASLTDPAGRIVRIPQATRRAAA